MEKKWFETDWVYDLESYPNVFTMTLIHASGKHTRQYEVSDRKNDTDKIADCLRYLVKNKCRMVGFNNIGYDYQLIHKIIENLSEAKKQNKSYKIKAYDMYKLTDHIISQMKDDGKMYGLSEDKHFIKQIDLYKINHFDNKAKATSLKVLEFNMRSESIEDLPFPVGKRLTNQQIDTLLEYNLHDVKETLKFYYYCNESLVLRNEIEEEFGFDCANFNDTKIGKELFIRSLEKESPGICYTVTPKGRKIRQTKRPKIVIKDCILPYIKFERPEFKAIHEWFSKQVITETKGVFTDILEHNLGDVAKYAEMVKKKIKLNNPENPKDKKYEPTEKHLELIKKQYPLGWLEVKELKSPKGAKSYYWYYNIAECLNVVVNGFRFDFGVGGIHGASQGVHTSDENSVIKTVDVASYYPNLAIKNTIYPEHLSEMFCHVYENLYEKRKSYPKGSGGNSALKLALNGTFGDSNNEFSPLYDPAYTMTITIGGQLSLCMLCEKLIDECSVVMKMANTDGIEFSVNTEMAERADEIVKEWEDLTKLTMEGDEYQSMYIRDVNSYISITKSGKVKTKGAYEVADFDKIGWHKNQSAMIVPKAIKEYIVNAIPFEKTIRECDNPYDMMLRVKVPRSSSLVLVKDEQDIPAQNICRYYPSIDGGKLVKLMPPLKDGDEIRRLGVDTEWNVKVCNKMEYFSWDDIDYRYYIQEAQKLIDGFYPNGEKQEENEYDPFK